MRTFYLCIAFFLPTLLYGQLPSPKQLWEQYITALEQDVALNQKLAQQLHEQERMAGFNRIVESIQMCFHRPYSAENIQKALEETDFLKKDSTLNKKQQEILDKQDSLICNYRALSEKFLRLFDGEIADARYGILSKKDSKDLTPGQIQTIASILKSHYEKNGLSDLTFPEEYIYFNKKVRELKEKLNILINTSDKPQKMFDQLESVLRIESEISEEHPTYHSQP